jgi:hypothetical protein
MVDHWLRLRAAGHYVLMLADERATVAALNQLAHHHLIEVGQVARRGRRYVSDDEARDIELAVGDHVILRRNDARLPQPDSTTVTVRNGMTGTVIATGRGSVTVELDPDHQEPDRPTRIVLPSGYVGADVDHGYARTVHTAQGATNDHSLYAPSPAGSAESAYVALSRGRHTNRIYATTESGWAEAITATHAHTLALHQQPEWTQEQNQGRQAQPDQTHALRRAQPDRAPAGARHRAAHRPAPPALASDTRARRHSPGHGPATIDPAAGETAPQPATSAARSEQAERQPAPEPRSIDLAL